MSLRAGRAHFFERRTLHRFLPDGASQWVEKGRPFQFVVEIDWTRESRRNLERKFKEYYAWTKWRSREWEEAQLVHVLVVTTGWERTGTIRKVVAELARGLWQRRLALWVTTFKDIETEGIEAPVWRYIEEWDYVQCLPCFQVAPSAEGASDRNVVGCT